MNKLFALMLSAVFATCAFAADPVATNMSALKKTAQQEKMGACHKKAEGKKGGDVKPS